MLYERRPGIQSNPHKDMFGKNYHAWLKLINDPRFSFVRQEYESFIGSYWTEPIRPQSREQLCDERRRCLAAIE
jgi:hypothetical protein